MEEDFESRHHRLEESNWWFVARRDMVLRLLRGTRKDAKILDIGCAGGSLVKCLRSRGFLGVSGVDASERAVLACRKRGLETVSLMDGTRMAFPDHSFDVVVASDVLEHIPDERAALSEWARVLKPGGKLVIFVPAFGFLWSGHDEANRHFRRYSKKELEERLGSCGFMVERSSYWNLVSFVPALLLRLFQRHVQHKNADQLYEMHHVLDGMLRSALVAENALLGMGAGLPVGVSVWSVARSGPGARETASGF